VICFSNQWLCDSELLSTVYASREYPKIYMEVGKCTKTAPRKGGSDLNNQQSSREKFPKLLISWICHPRVRRRYLDANWNTGYIM